MRVVQTYCNVTGERPSDFFLKMSRLSIETIRQKKLGRTILYTDIPEYFSGFPYDDIITTNFFTWNWDTRYWNIPKFHTYALQEEPFIHIDLDIALTNSFRIDYSKDFISERIRTISSEQFPYRHLSKELSDGTVLCSGIYGCVNTKPLDLFKELYEKAKVECVDGVNEEVNFEDLYSIEENWMKKRVNDLGFSIFEIKPYMFYHFGGPNKRDSYSNMVDILCKRYKIS